MKELANVQKYQKSSFFGKKQWILNNHPNKNMHSLTSLKVISFNIWFENRAFSQRMERILKLLQHQDADIVCLQEVNSSSLRLFQESGFIQKHYCLIGDEKDWKTHYGLLMLVKNTLAHIKAFKVTLPNSLQGRYILGVDLNWNGKAISIATVHLESNTLQDSSSFEKRRQQIIRASQLGSLADAVLLVGDVNIENDDLESTEPFQDAWIASGWPLENTVNVTYPTGFEPKRFDRVLYLDPHAMLHITDVSLLGRESFDLMGTVQYLSDHLAISFLFSCLSPGAETT